jgi:hypothetical protein
MYRTQPATTPAFQNLPSIFGAVLALIYEVSGGSKSAPVVCNRVVLDATQSMVQSVTDSWSLE